MMSNIINDIWDFLLIQMGITLSLFTLLYSFILSKKDQLLELSFIIKQGNKDPLHVQRQNNIIKYIKKLKSFNDKLVIATILSFLSSIIVWIIDQCFFLFLVEYQVSLFYIIALGSLVLMLYSVRIIYLLIINYRRDTRIT